MLIFFFLSAYIPTEPRTTQDKARVGKLWAFISRLLDNVPARCVPVLCFDGNGRVGTHQSTAVGPANSQRENWNGQQLRELCERHHLCLVNTFFNVGPTYRGEFSESRIDYIALPSSLLASVNSCAVFHRSGQRLQKIATPGWRDHRPLHCAFRHQLCYAPTEATASTRWDSDLLVRGVLDGTGKEALLTNVCSALHAQSLDNCADGPPGPYWQLLNQTVRDEAAKIYGQQPPTQTDRTPSDTQLAFANRTHALEQVVQLSPLRLQCDFLHLHDLHRVLHAWFRVARFWKARKHHEGLLKRDRRAQRCRHLHEFHTAWTGRNHACMWKSARSLANRALGPKRRRYDVPLAEQPSAGEWEEFFRQPASDGGCAADILSNFHQFLERDLHCTAVQSYAAVCSQAAMDYKAVKHLVWSHPFRKSVPTWSVPGEIWRMLLYPNAPSANKRSGLGFHNVHFDNTMVQKRLLQGFAAVRRYNRTPSQWQLSQTHKLSKRNGKEGCHALRTINSLDCIGKCFYKHVWRCSHRRSDRPYASGYAKGRSRIEAILQQHVVAERLRMAGLSFISCFHDIANAFPSMAHSCLRNVLQSAALPANAELLLQRVQETCMVVEGCDRSAVVVPGSGTLQGDTIAGDLFLEGYHPVVDKWTAQLSEHHPDYKLLAFSPLDLADVNLAVTTFADDLCRKILVQSVSDADEKVRKSNQVLDDALAAVGMAQNTSKQEHVAFFSGQHKKSNTHQFYKEQRLPGRAVPFAKYLGGFQTHNFSPVHELDFRVSRAYVAWCTFRNLWYSRELPWRGLRSIFLGMVYEVLFSGLEALFLSAVHIQRLDRVVLGYGRRLMRGKGCVQTQTETGETKYKQLPNLEVFRYLGVAPAHVELRIRRLKFLQMLAKDPFKHVQILTAIFGVFDFDSEPTLDPVAGLVPGANKYAVLFWNDLQSLASLDSAYWIVDMADNNIMAFFSDLAPDFIHVDVTELRSVELSARIPPPGFSEPEVVADEAEPCADDFPHECVLVLEDGSVCGKKFPSLGALLLHQRRSNAFNHGTVSDFFKAAHVNQCPWCFMVHANIISTRRHIRSRLQTGHCPAGSRCGSSVFSHPTPPADLVCKFCGHDSDDLPQLFSHIRSHFP